MSIFKPGDRVRVNIATEEERQLWNKEALNAFDGQMGTVEEVKPDLFVLNKTQYLIKFDTPVEKWALRSECQEMNYFYEFHFEEECLAAIF